jgi:RimJ/RimL family protein N-acetyltransferase
MAVVELVLLPAAALDALLRRDLAAASGAAGRELPAAFLDDERLWRLRLDQICADPDTAPWVAVRAIADAASATFVGHTGFHAPPDEAGMVEIGYFILPEHRRRGYARAALHEMIAYAAAHGARTIRASVAPGNEPSLALVSSAGFTRVGEQWDDEDGLELVFERPAR